MLAPIVASAAVANSSARRGPRFAAPPEAAPRPAPVLQFISASSSKTRTSSSPPKWHVRHKKHRDLRPSGSRSGEDRPLSALPETVRRLIITSENGGATKACSAGRQTAAFSPRRRNHATLCVAAPAQRSPNEMFPLVTRVIQNEG